MGQETLAQAIVDTLDGVDVVTADGNSFFFYNPPGETPPDHRFPFATIVANDLYDQFSDLDRTGVYRLNVGVSRQTYEGLFGAKADASGPSTTSPRSTRSCRTRPTVNSSGSAC